MIMVKKERDLSIDLMKGILAFFMIAVHILELFNILLDYNDFVKVIIFYIELTSFSGFLFCNGYVSYNAYISKNEDKKIFRKKMLKNFLKMLFVFYISGIASSILVSDDVFSFNKLIRIIFLREIPIYSEYLLSFAFIYLILYLFKDLYKKINVLGLLIIFNISLLLTLIDYSYVSIPLLGVFIGSSKYFCFPIIQYFSYYIIGIYLAKNKIVFNKYILGVSLFGFLLLLVYCFGRGQYPNRFPPSLFFIVGGYLFIYLYYIICKKIRISNKCFLISIGRNSLIYLIVSNIIQFICYMVVIEVGNLKLFFSNGDKFLMLFVIVFVLSILLSFMFSKLLIYRKRSNN